jgi:serine/threonine-protein kinase RsbW
VIKVTVVDLAAPGTAEQVRTFPGEVRQVRSARQFVGRALAGCPARDRLLTCVSELAANAIEHSDSGAGGTFTVAVGRPRDGVAFVAVTDAGGPDEPALGEPGDDLAEEGRGLALVAAFSSRWGFRDTGNGHVVWAEATWPVLVGAAGGARGRAADLWQGSWTNPAERPGVA